MIEPAASGPVLGKRKHWTVGARGLGQRCFQKGRFSLEAEKAHASRLV